MSRNDHGAYGSRYEVSTSAPEAGGHPAQPPHTGVEHPMASAPHVSRGDAHPPRSAPPVAAGLTLLAVVLGALAMIWPTHTFRQDLGSAADDEVLIRFWIHGATTYLLESPGTTVVRPMGLVLYVLLMLGAAGAALMAWRGRSVRGDALGLLGAAVFAGAMLVPSFMALSADASMPRNGIELHYDAGVWLAIASSLLGLTAAVLYFVRLGRRAPRRIHD